MRHRLTLIAVALALVATACGSSGTEADSTSPPPTEAAAADTGVAVPAAWPHDFEAPLVDGGTFNAGDYEGQDLVLWFWAPW